MFSLSLSADFGSITSRADAVDVATKKMFGSRRFLLSKYAFYEHFYTYIY